MLDGRRHQVQGGAEFVGKDLRKALDEAEGEAKKLRDDYVSTEHLLLGWIASGSTTLKRILDKHALKKNDVLKVLSHRYITDRFLPDEAASRLRMELDSMPTEIVAH